MGYMLSKTYKYRKKVLKSIMIFCIIVFLFTSIGSFVSNNVVPVIKRMGEAEVRALAISGINNAVHIVIDDSIDYKEFVNIERNDTNEIVMVQLNFIKINRLARDLANLSEANIRTITTQTIDIPLGAFSGSTIFAAFGPPVSVRLLPIGSVICDFISSFEESGINQTLHRLYIEIVTTICIVLPLVDIPLEIRMMVLIVENVIVGKVPDTYIKAATQLDALDLMP